MPNAIKEKVFKKDNENSILHLQDLFFDQDINYEINKNEIDVYKNIDCN